MTELYSLKNTPHQQAGLMQLKTLRVFLSLHTNHEHKQVPIEKEENRYREMETETKKTQREQMEQKEGSDWDVCTFAFRT